MKSNLSVRITNIAALRKKRVSLLVLLHAARMFVHADGEEMLHLKRV